MELSRPLITRPPTAVLVAAALGLAGHGYADPLAITRSTTDGGGFPFVQVGTIIMGGTAGQPDAGLLTGVGFSIAGGFWIPGNPMPLDVGGGGGPGTNPVAYALAIHPASPNPLHTASAIAFELPDERTGVVQIYDLRGALVRTVVRGRFTPGPHRFEWDGRDGSGNRVGAGVYLVRVRLGALERTQKLVVLR